MVPEIEQSEELSALIEQIVLTPNDSDYLNQLIPVIRESRSADDARDLIDVLSRISRDRETEIKKICNSNHQDFVSSVNRLLNTQQGSSSLATNILALTESIQASTERLLAHKTKLVDLRSVRDNIDETQTALAACLRVLQSANDVHEQLERKNYYGALQSLYQLQNVHLRDVKRYRIADLIASSVPETKQLISNTVMYDLREWLSRIRDAAQYLGEVAFYHSASRQERQGERAKECPYFSNFNLNSAVELVADELDGFDFLQNEETHMDIDFVPLLKAIHIHKALGLWKWFQNEYTQTRRQQMELIVPATLSLIENQMDFYSLLENVVGFALVEKFTMNHTDELRSPAEVDELWESMSQRAVALLSEAVDEVVELEDLLEVKYRITLLTQTMVPWGYSVSAFDPLIVHLFEQYVAVMKGNIGSSFERIVEEDDYTPMPIQASSHYEQIMATTWYQPPKSKPAPRFPMTLLFSQMYPLCCVDIRNFVNEIFNFQDDHLSRIGVIDQTALYTLDTLLCENICKPLVQRLGSQNQTLIAQIFTNLGYFEDSCDRLVEELFHHRPVVASTQSLVLAAKEKFSAGRQVAQRRVFELATSKIDDLIGTSEYDWTTTRPPRGASTYVNDLIQYLTIPNMPGLSSEVKKLVFDTTIKHACTSILALPLSQDVERISPAAAAAIVLDVQALCNWVMPHVSQSPDVRTSLAELRESVELMTIQDPAAFFDPTSKAEHYPHVDLEKGKVIVDKVFGDRASPVRSPPSPQMSIKQTGTKFSDRFRTRR